MFDRSLWRTQVGKRLDSFARNPQQDIILGGSPSLLVHLAMCTLEPFLLAFEEEPIAAIKVLSSIADGPGANMLVKRSGSLHYQMGRMLDQELRNNAELRRDVEALIVSIDTIHLVRQRLYGSREEWFRTTLSQELHTYPESEFAQIRRRLRDRWKSFYDIFRELRQRHGSYTQEDLILLYVGLNDSASHVRAEAARRLGEYAWTPPEKLIAKLLHVALYDRDLETRNAAARALGSLRDRIASPIC
ncbi:MAG: HEAT repeat domain-containing protein, partial [Chloroflexaceae bacterium]|nr:HEAT repeat domain-containing protein [Chloroflexaceae bacterium]